MDLISLITSIFLLIFLTHLPINLANVNCPISRCGTESGHPDIRYPFRLNGSEHPNICGSPGFDVSCDPTSNRTVIELQGLGNMFINNIDYGAQEIWVSDPNNCLPLKLLSLNLSNSPFSGIYLQDFGFFNCSTLINTSSSNNNNNNNNNNDDGKSHNNMIGPIKCLSSTNYFVYATPSNGTVLAPPTCNLTKIVKVPVQWPPWLHQTTFLNRPEFNEDLRLTWFMPECQPCELNGQRCGLETNSNGSLITVCSNIPISNGTKTEKLPTTTVIAIILVICSPSIICIIVSIWIWIRACIERRSTRILQQNQSILTQRPNGPSTSHLVELGGLEEFNIDFARQMVLLGLTAEADPDPNFEPNIVFSEIEEEGLGAIREGDGNNTCAICMGEYEMKDKIGSLVTCGHYFHAYCINTWLIKSPRIIGKTCPICRARLAQ